MASSKDELNRQRAETVKRHRAATRKVSRLNTRAGVELSGTREDPRRELAKVKRYSAKQLEAYNKQLDQFLDRGTQFVKLGSGEIISAREWQPYKRAENRARRQAGNRLGKVGGIKLPERDETVAQRQAKIETKHPRAANPAVNSIFQVPEREPGNIANRKALKALTKDMEKRISRGWEDKQISEGKKSFRKMAKKSKGSVMGNTINDFSKRIGNMSSEQFGALWNLTGFATNFSITYESIMALLQGKGDSSSVGLVENELKEAEIWIKWAENFKLDS